MVACPTNQEFRGNHWDTVCELRLCIPPVVRRIAKFKWDCNHIRWSTSDATTTHGSVAYSPLTRCPHWQFKPLRVRRLRR